MLSVAFKKFWKLNGLWTFSRVSTTPLQNHHATAPSHPLLPLLQTPAPAPNAASSGTESLKKDAYSSWAADTWATDTRNVILTWQERGFLFSRQEITTPTTFRVLNEIYL